MNKNTTSAVYERGMTTLFACQADQRFSYCMHVPGNYNNKLPIVVLMHGTHRRAFSYRDLFTQFSEEHGCIVMAPLFPAGIIEQGELSNYKFIKFHDIRYDHILLSMLDEVSGHYGCSNKKFFLFGFSGGAHFAHRFFYLHPERLVAVSIGAPGMVTLLDREQDWWCGVRDLEQQFGKSINIEAMKSVSVQMVIGAEDTETWEITIKPESRFWMPRVNEPGRTRLERMVSLKQSFEAAGLSVQHDIVPGIAHDGFSILEPVKKFFAGVLKEGKYD